MEIYITFSTENKDLRQDAITLVTTAQKVGKTLNQPREEKDNNWTCPSNKNLEEHSGLKMVYESTT